MIECTIYYANDMQTRDDVDDELHASIDDMCLRMNIQMNNDERREIVNAYYECFDVDDFIDKNNASRATQKFDYVYSRMHAQSFVIMNMFDVMNDMRSTQIARDE
jgi:hypothetical protein